MFRFLVFLLAALAGASAAAQGTAVQCVGTVTVSYSPPLTNTAQSTLVTVSEVHNPCLHIPTSGLPFLQGATVNAQFSRVISCTTLLSGGPGVSLVHWANGDTSTINWTSTVNYISGSIVVVRTGTVASGRYAGESTAETVIVTPILEGNLDFINGCASTGMPQATGPYTMTYTP